MKHGLKVGKSSREASLEVLYIAVCLYRFYNIFDLNGRIRAILHRCKDLLLKRRECLPILMKVGNLAVRNTTEHGRVNIVFHRCFLHWCFAGIDIAWDIEVVFVTTNLIPAYLSRISLYRLSLTISIGNLLHVTCTEFVLFAILHETFAGIDDEHTFAATVLLQNHDECRNAGTKEDVGRKTDDGIDIVLLNEVGTNLTL